LAFPAFRITFPAFLLFLLLFSASFCFSAFPLFAFPASLSFYFSMRFFAALLLPARLLL
jgi:hypothetical protein